jgi:transposase
MKSKVREKEKAIELRRQGYSYKDILAQVPVAKSSISLWLQNLPLTAEEKNI